MSSLELGIPPNPDFNSSQSYGLGTYHLTLGSRFRSSAASAFLRPILARKNLKVITDTFVKKVLIENGEVIEKGTHEKLMASRGLYHKLYKNNNPEIPNVE